MLYGLSLLIASNVGCVLYPSPRPGQLLLLLLLRSLTISRARKNVAERNGHTDEYSRALSIQSRALNNSLYMISF